MKAVKIVLVGMGLFLCGRENAWADTRQMTFAEAVETSVKRAPEVATAVAGVSASEEKNKATGAQRYPKLRAEANLLRWDTPLLIDFGPMNAMPGAAPNSRLVARDQYTSSALISLSQPISGLFVLGHMIAIENSAVKGAKADVTRSRLDAAQNAAEAYLRVLQAGAIAKVAQKGVDQMAAQLARAETMEKAGVLSRVDVLRLVSSRDAAKQTLVRAHTQREIASGQLAVAVDLPPDTQIDVVDDFPDPPVPLVVSEAEVMRKAGANRPELATAQERVTQARGARTVAHAQWLPNIMGIGTFAHVTGQGPFQPRNAWYIGATLTWDIWDWGKTGAAVNEAEARSTQAQLAERILRNQIVLEARRRLLEAHAAFATLAPARTSQEAAEEAHRMQTVRYEKGVANTTDIIDAETDLLRARSAYAQARYDFYLAQAMLARAAGAMPMSPMK